MIQIFFSNLILIEKLFLKYSTSVHQYPSVDAFKYNVTWVTNDPQIIRRVTNLSF